MGSTRDRAEEAEVFARSQVFINADAVSQKACKGARGFTARFFPDECDGTLLKGRQAGQNPKQGRFARTVSPQ